MDSEDIIDKIQAIRAENNKLWMELLRVAFYWAPEESRKIMQRITKNDQEVSKWTAQL